LSRNLTLPSTNGLTQCQCARTSCVPLFERSNGITYRLWPVKWDTAGPNFKDITSFFSPQAYAGCVPRLSVDSANDNMPTHLTTAFVTRFLIRVFVDHCASTENVHLEKVLPIVTAHAFRIQDAYSFLLDYLTATKEAGGDEEVTDDAFRVILADTQGGHLFSLSKSHLYFCTYLSGFHVRCVERRRTLL
jgi:hypothetical protein